MLNRCRTFLSIVAMALAVAGSARVANAQAQIYVGYADDLRGSNFPSVWSGSPGVQYFLGTTAPGADAGAIMIHNNTPSPFTIDAFSVDIGTSHFGMWTTFPLTLNAGMSAIFTETTHYDFDTSDPFAGPCSSPNTVVPKVNVSINGTANSYDDSGLILTTGGVDFASCVGNEALGWRLIGTTGVNDPGNQLSSVPEPSAIVLFGSGLVGLAGFLRRRKD